VVYSLIKGLHSAVTNWIT